MVSIARTALATAFSLGLAVGASATTITSGNTPTSFYSGFGVNQAAGIAGQTFQAPAPNNILTQFSLTLGTPPSGDLPTAAISAIGLVYEWGPPIGNSVNGAPAGSPLFQSAPVPVDLDLMATGQQTFVFNVLPNLVLDPALTYVALISLLGNSGDGTTGAIGFGVVEPPEGEEGLAGLLVFGTVRPPPSEDETVTSDLGFDWFVASPTDALFSATFEGRQPVGVPAPASFALFAVGLAGLLATRRRKAA